MKIKFHKHFEKRLKKLSPTIKNKTISAIKCFSEDPFDKKLKNHALRGKLKGKRAFSVSGDIRVIFEEFDDYILVIMLDVGSHAQVYEM
ncbi:type II toxin-antitoxin system mRNA interferase toxin, RelE/StbE family [Candidatus Peregrinibacteria bacterium]|nr:type II toxin-antitoxin system mRNA interferase toxin, RelE/StbE family [Candidatus Peregrinibacteria bacterium]